MTDTIRELINRVLDYVERTPGAHFEIARWREGIVKPDENQMHFEFHIGTENRICNISRNGDKYWSQFADLDEDNLRHLLEQLEVEE